MPSADSTIPPVIWELTTLTPADAPTVDIDNPSQYTLQFLPDGTLGIRADCNQAAGTYEINYRVLRVKVTAATLALCPPDSHSDPYLKLLQAASSFEHDENGHLVIRGDSGTLLFRPILTGVVWEWQDFRGGDDSVVTPPKPSHYTLAFLPDGKLAIRADCNRARGTYTVDGDRLELKIGAVTRAYCGPNSLMDPFLRDLDASSSHVFRNGNLFLALPLDSGILSFHARPEPSPESTPTPE